MADVADFIVQTATIVSIVAVITQQTILVTLMDAGEGLCVVHVAGECTVAVDNSALCADHEVCPTNGIPTLQDKINITVTSVD